MVEIDGLKYACQRCIRGHRVSGCQHTDQELYLIKPKGRPSSQCQHCKEARKSKSLHTKCTCAQGPSVNHESHCPCFSDQHLCTCSKNKNAARKRTTKTGSPSSTPPSNNGIASGPNGLGMPTMPPQLGHPHLLGQTPIIPQAVQMHSPQPYPMTAPLHESADAARLHYNSGSPSIEQHMDYMRYPAQQHNQHHYSYGGSSDMAIPPQQYNTHQQHYMRNSAHSHRNPHPSGFNLPEDYEQHYGMMAPKNQANRPAGNLSWDF